MSGAETHWATRIVVDFDAVTFNRGQCGEISLDKIRKETLSEVLL